jgi:hypothetical protein
VCNLPVQSDILSLSFSKFCFTYSFYDVLGWKVAFDLSGGEKTKTNLKTLHRAYKILVWAQKWRIKVHNNKMFVIIESFRPFRIGLFYEAPPGA